MKIVVTGSGGQLGNEWNRFLRGKDYDLDAFKSDDLDITQSESVKKTLTEINPDVLINCAAYTAVDKAEEEKELAKSVNCEAVKEISHYCKQLDIKLVHFSTDYVFAGNENDRKRYPDGYPENHSVNPINWYGKTKWEGEQAIRESGCEHLIIRTTWLCSRFGDNFVKTMLKLGANRDEVKVVDDQWGSPSFTADVVKNTQALIALNKTGTYNITSRGLITWYELARTIFDYSDIEVNILRVTSDEFKTKAKRPFFSKLSTEKVEEVEGVEIKDWQVGLKNLLNDLKNS